MANQNIESLLKSVDAEDFIPSFKKNKIGLELLLKLPEKRLRETLTELGLEIGPQLEMITKLEEMKIEGM